MQSLGLTVFFARRTNRCEARVDKVFSDYHGLQCMHGGGVALSYGDRAHRLEGDWIWPTGPGPRIRYQPLAEPGWWNHRFILFRGERVAEWERYGLWPTAPVQLRNAGVLIPLLDHLIDCFHKGSPQAHRRFATDLERFLIALSEENEATRADGLIARVKEALHDDIEKEMDYTALAAECGVSERTLRRRFHDATGQSPHQFRLQARVASAHAMIAGTTLPIKDIADRLGYRDVYFFSRQFRQVTGVAPTKIRRMRGELS